MIKLVLELKPKMGKWFMSDNGSTKRRNNSHGIIVGTGSSMEECFSDFIEAFKIHKPEIDHRVAESENKPPNHL